MHWSFYAVLSAIFAALVAVFGKIGLREVDSTLATALRAVVMALFLVGVSFFFGKFSFFGAVGGRAFVFIILSGLAGAVSWLFYFFAIKSGTVSGVVAIDRTSVIFALCLAVFFLGEVLSAQKIIGVLLLVIGAVLVAL